MNKIFTFLVFILTFSSGFSQEETEKKVEKKFSFSGSIDTYFRYNLNAPNNKNRCSHQALPSQTYLALL
jgi:uncharacterized iron-regulated protein